MFKTATIDLELNKGNFLAGLEKIKKSFSDFGSNVQKSFNNNLGALGSLYLHTKALRNVFGDVKKVVDFSQLYSLNAEKVSEFRNQFALFGGTVDDVLKIQKKFQDGLKDFRVEGKGLFLDLAKQFKITPQKGNGQFLGFDEFVEKLREVYKSSNDVGKQKLLSNFDNDLGLLRLLQATDEEYEATAAQAKKMGVINERTAKTIREFINVFQTFTRLLKNMGVYVLDVLNPIVKGLNFCIMALMELGEGTKKFLAALLLIRPVLAILQLLAGSLKSLALTGKMLFNTFFGLGKMLISFGKIFVGVFKFNPLATFIASVTFLIWQLKKLKDNWQDVKDM
ncbi:MAG: hypothetical protein LBG48_03735, partial [Rickettsiales bacterium]|nr:hypothetical protein [Rickettsiales bacterium]